MLAVVETIAVGDSPFALAVSPNGNRLYVANIDSSDVSVVSTSSGNTTDTIPVGSSANSIAHHPNGTRVYPRIATLLREKKVQPCR